MSKKTKGETGFTLIEVLLILALLTSSIVIANSIAYRQSIKLEEAQFFLLLEQDLLAAQAIALELHTPVVIRFFYAESKYTMTAQFKTIKTVLFPETVQFLSSSYLKTIEYSSTGNVVNFGTCYFTTTSGKITLTLYIGKGRVRFDG
ncbi:hypothetical protein CF394_04580 [Tetzosporium hominis]|uniref:Prepilin-type cleavage/methylation domain-containing protein n=1 Tax=Tetzosporium hominis TaxID=2020506 RepID=A0A264W5E7_9BACL|nr:competence type IV pilus minor pilin ComGD [Tetzosporium hominis]OZS78818.1 hypothetical protein CF394_04580 [Tetzosporium hominis]